MKAFIHRILAFALLSGALGCSENSPSTADATVDAAPYTLTILQALPDGGTAPISDDASVEIFLGFQGFQYLQIALAAEGAVPDQTQGHARLSVAGGDPLDQVLNTVNFGPPVNGVRYVRKILVFDNDALLPALVGRSFSLSVDLSDPGHRAQASISGILWWDSHCVADGNGACLPPDGGVPDATSGDLGDGP